MLLPRASTCICASCCSARSRRSLGWRSRRPIEFPYSHVRSRGYPVTLPSGQQIQPAPRATQRPPRYSCVDGKGRVPTQDLSSAVARSQAWRNWHRLDVISAPVGTSFDALATTANPNRKSEGHIIVRRRHVPFFKCTLSRWMRSRADTLCASIRLPRVGLFRLSRSGSTMPVCCWRAGDETRSTLAAASAMLRLEEWCRSGPGGR